jgi:hypothetical protein
MEYNLQKTIEQNLFCRTFPNTSYPSLTPYPAIDYVNPGCGGINKLYSFYVPLFSQHVSSYQIKKQSDINSLEIEKEQLGEGNNDEESTNEDVSNAKKRKLVGESIYDSFMHPKVFKTKKLYLSGNEKSQIEEKEKQSPKSKEQNTLKGDGKKSKKTSHKHKFQFY